MIKQEHWIKKQNKDAEKVLKPKMFYDKENDILSIFWFPNLKYDFSLETTSGFIFDISKKPEQAIKGIEIFNFMKKIKLKKEIDVDKIIKKAKALNKRANKIKEKARRVC